MCEIMIIKMILLILIKFCDLIDNIFCRRKLLNTNLERVSLVLSLAYSSGSSKFWSSHRLDHSVLNSMLTFSFVFTSRGANYLTQILLRPGASDLTGSFRYI